MSAPLPQLRVRIAFSSPAFDPSPVYTDVSSLVRDTEPVTIRRGRQLELNRVEAGRATLVLHNKDGRFDPFNTNSPYYPNVRPYRRIEIAAIWQSVTYVLFVGFCRFAVQWGDSGSRENLCRVEAVDALDYFARLPFSVDSLFTYTTVSSSELHGVSIITDGFRRLRVRMAASPGGSPINYTVRGYRKVGDSFLQEETFTLSASNYADGVASAEIYQHIIQLESSGPAGQTFEILGAPAFFGTTGDAYIADALDLAAWPSALQRLDMGDMDPMTFITPPAAAWGDFPVYPLAAIGGVDTFLGVFQRVAESEVGLVFVGADGAIVFQNQTRRIHSYTSPLGIFGSGAGEYPYEAPTFDDGETLIFNQARITPEGRTVQIADTDAGVTEYGRRVYQRSSIGQSPDALRQAQRIVNDYQAPRPRVTSIGPLGHATTGAPWALLLGAELSQVVTARLRPPGTPTVDQHSYIESIAWMIRRGSWRVQWGLSPADQTNDLYTVFGGGDAVAFPTSPVLYQRVFRTDLGLLCFYDGTRWLTADEYVAVLPALSASGDSLGGHVAIRQDWAPYVTRIAVSHIVATTNNGSNYWTLFIRGVNAAYSTTTTIHAPTTAANTAGTWASPDITSVTTRIPTDRTRIDIFAQKTGSPGALTANVTVYYRLIVT